MKIYTKTCSLANLSYYTTSFNDNEVIVHKPKIDYYCSYCSEKMSWHWMQLHNATGYNWIAYCHNDRCVSEPRITDEFV